jgi:hypothetical protein
MSVLGYAQLTAFVARCRSGSAQSGD